MIALLVSIACIPKQENIEQATPLPPVSIEETEQKQTVLQVAYELMVQSSGSEVESIQLQCKSTNYDAIEITDVVIEDHSPDQNFVERYTKQKRKSWVFPEYEEEECVLQFFPSKATVNSVIVEQSQGGMMDCILSPDGTDVVCRCHVAECPPENGEWFKAYQAL